MEKDKEYMEIDLYRLAGALWNKAWAIILTALIVGGCVCACTMFLIKPVYKSRTLLYVNNNALSVGDAKLSISQGDLTAAQSLIDTYGVILKTRSTLEEVIELSGVDYTYDELVKMIDSASINDTEVFYVEVTSESPYEAEKLANTIGQVLPEKIASIVDGSSVRIVDYAVVPTHKAAPSITKNTILGVLVGVIISCCAVIVLEIKDDQVHDTDYLLQTYDLPVLAVIPELVASAKEKNEYYYQPPNKNQTYGRRSSKGGKHSD